MTSKFVRNSTVLLALFAISSGSLMAHAQHYDAKQAIQDEYNERVQFNQGNHSQNITNDLIKVLYDQSIQDVITESKQLILLHSVYQSDVAHGAHDQLASDLARIEEQKSRLLKAQQRVYGYATAMANHQDPQNMVTN
ncbi:hypothetical protein LHV13_03105 [Ferrovum sp. PN-J185]|uniref:hypothetical protein n=1 Tax=Ferrovum sp. PN-J185 TaxID=1356306 RepID=UPI0007987957|nr:hypothetical protein [Ferrovum sp. PN-J185]KXW56488.1 hypothetical protein FV185_04370 [Ferrovum sp. PN-J185]MCC6068163.1 hypothetical protein [Ferrovum sp. PN-J185]MDE1891724.1 hypothetical protein [Betaproteobacteria bacterium]MDE2056434.1 hypothetical protein [Betaproteobacteria bacterium]